MDMETKDTHIRRLIDRYFEGLTSLDEEKELSEYFRGGEVREEFRRFAPLFAFRDACAYGHDMPERKTGIRPKALKTLVAAVAAVAAAAVVCAAIALAVVLLHTGPGNDPEPETQFTAGKGRLDALRIAGNIQSLMDMADGHIASVSARPSGDAALVTARFTDGTSRLYIMTYNGDEGSASLVALNE